MKLERGNPKATAEAVFKIARYGAAPLRLILGSTALREIRTAMESSCQNYSKQMLATRSWMAADW
jgi:hypothetical protein